MQNRKNDCDNSNINALNGLKNTKNLQKSVANYSSSLSLDQQSNQKSSPKTVRFGQKRSSQRESSNFDKSLQMSKNLSSNSLSNSRLTLTRQRTLRKHPINTQGREIIQNCFDEPHRAIGEKICFRLMEKRKDYRTFAERLRTSSTCDFANDLRTFLDEIVKNNIIAIKRCQREIKYFLDYRRAFELLRIITQNLKIDDIEMIERTSYRYGAMHAELKRHGFKSEFWVPMADLIFSEAVRLDLANHQPSDTATAWTQLITIVFSSMRDGYYDAIKQRRQSSMKRSVQSTVDFRGTTNSTTKAIQDTKNELKASTSLDLRDSSNLLRGSDKILLPSPPTILTTTKKIEWT
ncbi:unnamed protein product [Dracunculus medinensis]|uniref:GLOBIN domain-containing protein n=1 Tax=Dracunculus medinensis TaxID=318479 RepID=A0A0N4UJ82_DRAME|nr:unnamed protein product [Dracunculus medinensis]